MTGVDVPISLLRNDFAANLWPGVPKQIYYARASRNAPKDQDGVIPEIFTGKGEYKELYLDDNYNVVCFFDAVDTLTTNLEPGNQPRSEVGIIFAVNLEKVYPDITDYRPTEEVARDVKKVIENFSPGSTVINEIVRGREAYDGFNADRALSKFPNMSPWHLFRFNTSMAVSYDCDVTTTISFMGFDYPFPIILS